MGPKDRREREKADLRNKIIEAARQMFADYGYEKVSMRMIADKIEYSPTAIYLHFKDKDALFAELCRQDFSALAEVFNRIARIEDPMERLRSIGHAYVQFGLQYPNHYRLMFMTPHPVHHPEVEEGRKGNPEHDAYEFLRVCIRDCIASGRLRPELHDADLIAQTCWAALHGVVALQIAMAKDDWVALRPATMTAQLILDVMMRGMLREEQNHG
jgi:AcrR family transcriptional regulator